LLSTRCVLDDGKIDCSLQGMQAAVAPFAAHDRWIDELLPPQD
jgi:hypothetical protein